jgi:GTP-binding protein HflX
MGTIEVQNKELEKTILVGVRTGAVSKEEIEEHMNELEMLASTAGAYTVIKMIQDRIRIEPAYFIGKGKAEELAELVELNDIDLVIFDDDLTSTQVRNLERLINKKIVDRSGLILDIFASHAKTQQAKTQVELAQLQYLLPRLTRAWTHLSKQYGGIGTKGPGETQIETDRRIVRTRISKLKERLKKIDSTGRTKSLKRREFMNATFVGYTNAGKSTLINLLTGADVYIEDQLFATLDSTTRAYDLARNKSVMISDTVGFIRKLPHHLIESFKSTLNVVRDADIILHVIDISDDFFEDHIKVVEETLKDLGCDKKKQLKIFNKVDELAEKERMDYVSRKYEGSITISAKKGMNINILKQKLLNIYEESYKEHTIFLQHHESKKVSQIHSLAEVLSTKYHDDKVEIKFRTDKSNLEKIERMVNSH